MKNVIRYIIGGFSLLLIGAVVFLTVFLQFYTKGHLYSENYPMQSFTNVVVSEDHQNYYDYGFLVRSGHSSNRCGYISKYDNNDNMIKNMLIDDVDSQNQMTEPTFLYEKDSFLFVAVSTMTDNSRTMSILKLNKDDLSVIERNELDWYLEDVGVYDADESGFLFSNLHSTVSVIKIIKTDFEGNILNSVEIPNQIRLDFLDYDYILSTLPPEANGIDTEAILTGSKVKLYEDKIYFCGTIARKGAYENKHTGVVMCFDNSGNVIWRNDKTPIYLESKSVENISRYNDIYIDGKKIFIVGSEGKYRYDSDLPEKEKGTMLTPVIDEYDLNGNFIISNLFENKNKSSGFDKILKTNDGFLLLGWPRSENTIGGYSIHQNRKVNDLILNAIINKNAGFYTQVIDNKIIGRVWDSKTGLSTLKVYKNYQQFSQTQNFLSFLRGVQNYQARIIVILSIIAIFYFLPLVKQLFTNRKRKAGEPT